MNKREVLFLAIGELEENQLQQSEVTVYNPSNHLEVTRMFENKIRKRKLFPRVLVAALIAVMLGTSVFAAIGFIMFENPKQMIAALFGNETGQDEAKWSVPDNSGNVVAEYSAERVSVDESISETMEPMVEAVGRSLTVSDHTLMVDSYMYDAETRCGFVTYSIENPDGLRSYEVGPTGEVWFPTGDLLDVNQYGYSYVIADKCTDTKLCAAYYFKILDPQDSELKLGFTFWASVEAPETFSTLPDSETQKVINAASKEQIVLHLKNNAGMHTVSFGDGTVIISPIAAQTSVNKLGEAKYISEMKLTFQDGQEYIIQDDSNINYQFNVGDEAGIEQTYMFNRLVDVDTIAFITVNGIVFNE